jgi:hypothetical protein
MEMELLPRARSADVTLVEREIGPIVLVEARPLRGRLDQIAGTTGDRFMHIVPEPHRCHGSPGCEFSSSKITPRHDSPSPMSSDSEDAA